MIKNDLNILLVADIHFPNLSLDKITPTLYLNTFENNFHVNRLILLSKEINKINPDRVYILGDFLDKSYINLATLTVINNFINNINATVYYLNGNHEKISHQEYLLHYISNFINIHKIPENELIFNTSVNAYGHDNLDKLIYSKSDILLSHFRWYHELYGRGELSKDHLNMLIDNHSQLYLGDIHYQHEPAPNVHYIGQPYASKYYSHSYYSLTLLSINESGFSHERVPVDLPSKYLHKLSSTDVLQSYLDNLPDRHLHKVELTLNSKSPFVKNEFNIKPNVMIVTKELTSDEVESVELDTINVKDAFMSMIEINARPFIGSIIEEA